jgi:hypothetical protein
MHSRELVELGALIAMHSPAIMRGTRRLANRGIEAYWSASKCRLDRWSTSLKRFATQIQHADDPPRDPQGQILLPVLEEILTGEVLTRTWTAVAVAHDHLHRSSEIEPVARSVLLGHLEARNRALNLILGGEGPGIARAVELNQLRRRSERWTDMLLGYVMAEQDVGEFAFDRHRARDFADDLRRRKGRSVDACARQLVMVALRAAFEKSLSPISPNADLNEHIATSLLCCLPSDLFETTGWLNSLWMLRLNHTTSKTQDMIDELLSVDDPPALHSDAFTSRTL